MCFYALVGLIAPRLALFIMWMLRSPLLVPLTPWWVGLLGWLFLPFTTLAYVLIHWISGDVDGALHIVILIAALLVDVGAVGKSRRSRVRVKTS